MSIYFIVSIAFIILLLNTLSKIPGVKGWWGECQVRIALRLLLDKNKYQIINNVLINDDEGGTTQIDHLVLSKYGIFVVETKNMTGWIFGDAKAKVWTQTIYRKKSSFQNPFRQNYKHIVCLSKAIRCPIEAFHHAIVFVGDAVIKTPDTLPPALAANGGKLLRYIKSFTEEILEDESLAEIARRIEKKRLENTYANHKKHVKYLKDKHQK